MTDMTGNFASNWHVSDMTSLLDHRYTLFQVGDLEIIKVTYPKPKRMNWESYQEDIKVKPGVVSRVVH